MIGFPTAHQHPDLCWKARRTATPTQLLCSMYLFARASAVPPAGTSGRDAGGGTGVREGHAGGRCELDLLDHQVAEGLAAVAPALSKTVAGLFQRAACLVALAHALGRNTQILSTLPREAHSNLQDEPGEEPANKKGKT